MRARWEAVRSSLLSSVTTLQANREFRALSGVESVLGRFESPEALVAYLTLRDGDLDDKNDVYHVLVAATKGGHVRSDLAKALLWLGLWPGLDAIYRRKLSRTEFARNTDALVSEISFHFTQSMSRADLSKIRRVAATLIRNTERDIVRALVSVRREEGLREGVPEDEELSFRRKPSPFATPPKVLDELNVISMVARIDRVAAEDRELLRGVLLLGETQREVAKRLGISYEAVRKRFQRAVKRLRRDFEADPVPFVSGNRRLGDRGRPR